MKQEGELKKQQATDSAAPKLDLSFKEGQTIKISIGVSVKLCESSKTKGAKLHSQRHSFLTEYQEERRRWRQNAPYCWRLSAAATWSKGWRSDPTSCRTAQLPACAGKQW